jgi:hypothetical protein
VALKKKKAAPRREDHGKLLAAKIVAKTDTRGVDDIIKDRQAARMAKRDELRQKQLDLKREQEKEQARLEQMIKPYDMAQERMKQCAWECQQQQEQQPPETPNSNNDIAQEDVLDLGQLAECKQLQLDEILALEAIYDGLDTFLVSDACQLEEQRQVNDEWQMDTGNQDLLQTMASHPLISFTLQMIVEDPSGERSDWAVCLLLQVTFPALYPLYGDTPQWEVIYFMLQDTTAVCSSNKPLESLGYLKEDEFVTSLVDQARQLHTDPCVYEVVSTWLPDNLFHYITY